MGQASLDDLLRLIVVLGLVALDEGYGLREDRYVAAQNALDIFIRREGAAALAHEMGIDDGLVGNTLGDVQRRVVVRVGILLFEVFYL